jgi:hypothetical protein
MLYKIGKACALDIESNRLLEDSINFKHGFPLKLKNDSALWCITIVDIDTGESFIKKHDSIEDTKKWLKDTLDKFDTIITHNGIKFDLPTLFLFGVIEYTVGYLNNKDTVFDKECNLIDTLILSRILNPSRPNGHSLESWGNFLGDQKINYKQKLIDLGVLDKHAETGEEFSFYHPEMLVYCEQDSALTGRVFKKCWNDIEDYEHQAIKIEHKLADLAINREMFGFDFDSKFAKECIQDLDRKLQELREKVNPLLPLKPFNKSELNEFTPPKNQLKKDGSLSSHMINFIKHYQLEVYSYIDTKKTVFKFEENEQMISKTRGIIYFVIDKGAIKLLSFNPSKGAVVMKSTASKEELNDRLTRYTEDKDEDGKEDYLEECLSTSQEEGCVKTDTTKRDTNGDGFWDGIEALFYH